MEAHCMPIILPDGDKAAPIWPHIAITESNNSPSLQDSHPALFSLPSFRQLAAILAKAAYGGGFNVLDTWC